MKLKNIFLFCFSLSIFHFSAHSQAPVTNGGEYFYTYKLNKQQVRWMIDSPWISNNYWILTDLVDSNKVKGRYGVGRSSINPKNHPKGYYLHTEFKELSINTKLQIEPAFFPTVQETNKDWWFIMRDTMQNIVKNGKLTIIKADRKDTVFNYDSSCLCYQTPKLVEDYWLLFEAGDEFYYMYMQSPYKKIKPKWWKFWKRAKYRDPSLNKGRRVYRPRLGRRIINWVGSIGKVFKRKPTLMSMNPGYVVINQPKFKHYDTLKMKSFLVNRRGKPLRKKLVLQLNVNDNRRNKTLFTQKIKPITRGAYTYEFVIPDTFSLDKSYTLSLREDKYRRKKVRKGRRWVKTNEKMLVGKTYKRISFKVEDYELNKIKYTWEDKKKEYYRGKRIWFYAKAVDANNLPVADAKVRFKLNIRRINDTYDSVIKIADTVFKSYFDTTLNCSPDGLTPIELPGHLIPNADIEVQGVMTFTNADNKPGRAKHYFKILANSRRYYVVEDSNGLRAGYLVQGSDSVGGVAQWKVLYRNNVHKVKEISLPHYENWETGAISYQLLDTTGRVLQTYRAPKNPPKAPRISINKTHDSLYVSFNNPMGLEVAYRIYSDDELLHKGAAPQINYAIKLKGKKPVRVIYTYSWAGGIFTKEAVGWVKEKQLKVAINQPATVFPGQDVAIEITVTDYKNRPVKKANLTAYAQNLEVNGVIPPQVPYYGKSYGRTLQARLLNYPQQWFGRKNFSLGVMDNSMFHRLQLYRFPYYRLVYAPKAIGVELDSLSSNKTQLSLFPYDLEPKKRKIKTKGFYAAWLDNEMIFYGVAANFPNAFTVQAGKHTLKIRAAYHMYEFEVDIKEGWRNLVGLNSDSVYLNKNIKVTRFNHKGLSKEEKQAYNPNNAKVLFIAGDKTKTKNRTYASTLLNSGYIKQGTKVYQINKLTLTNKVKPYVFRVAAPLNEGDVELVLPNSDTFYKFYFNPAYMYLFNGKTVKPYKESYEDPVIYSPANRFSFNDTATEIPPFKREIERRREKKKPKVNKIKVYKPKTLFDHPMVKAYEHPRTRYNRKPSVFRLEAQKRGVPRYAWFFNKDSFEFSSIKTPYNKGRYGYNLQPGRYDILLANDTHDYKIIKNFKVDTGFNFYFKPSLYGYTPYDTSVLLPYIEMVKLLNRGPVPAFYKSPVKINVRLSNEADGKEGEKVVGEFSVNGRFIYNALVVLEDGKGNFITAGTTNGFGFYQIPVKIGNYTLKVYTPQWDMFYTDNIIVTKNYNTIAHLNITGYTDRVARESYNRLNSKQRTAQPTKSGRQPAYNNSIKARCTVNCGEIRGLVWDAATGEELLAVSMVLKGTNIGMTTDYEGSYSIKNLKPGKYSLVAKYVGFQTKEVTGIVVKANQITYVNFDLLENVSEVAEVTIQSRKRRRDRNYSYDAAAPSGSYDMEEADEVSIESIQSVPVRSNYSINAIANSVSGEAKLKGARSSGTAYYIDGKRVVGNVKLNDEKLVKRKDEDKRLQQMLGNANAMRVRKDFRDYAYWIPNLLTNRKGKSGFTVRIPDNQTQWVTYVPAMDYRCKSGLGVAYMRAYKPITANLSIPNFMVVGDKLKLFGKSVNYTSDSVVLNTTLKVNDNIQFNRPMGVRYFDTAAFTYQPKKAGLNKLLYQVSLPNGYLDGDQRNLRIKENGLLVSYGETRTLKGDVSFSLLPQQGYKNRRVILSNKKAELVMAEIEQLKNYEYGCVEQTASKLKALLLEKELAKSLNHTFTDDRYIKDCIKRLQKYQNKDGSWGWWAKSPADIWMTIYATDALYKAQKAGYKTRATLAGASYVNSRYRYLSISDKLRALKLFATMRYRNVSREIRAMQKLNLNLQDYLMLIRAYQLQGNGISSDSIIKLITKVGDDQAFWGEKLFSIYVNELNTSALAYEIIKANRAKDKGKNEELLKKVRNYFLQQPPTKRNTIQSATFLETFLRDIVTEDQKREELIPELKLNGIVEERRSILLNLEETDTLSISKKGSELYYLYTWQKFEANPRAKTKDFKVTTTFKQGTKPVNVLQVGKSVTLHVEVSTGQEHEYVMVEIPIPAGFSYESKPKMGVHTEYFSDKVAIFFTKMNKGHYNFDIRLLPKFTGDVTLLPAKAEEMYFPIRSGNNTKRIITIK